MVLVYFVHLYIQMYSEIIQLSDGTCVNFGTDWGSFVILKEMFYMFIIDGLSNSGLVHKKGVKTSNFEDFYIKP